MHGKPNLVRPVTGTGRDFLPNSRRMQVFSTQLSDNLQRSCNHAADVTYGYPEYRRRAAAIGAGHA
jgi:hypothetical protein